MSDRILHSITNMNMLLPVNDTTVEMRLTIFGARISKVLLKIYYEKHSRISAVLGAALAASTLPPPPSLVQGRGEEG
jgi:hypothetical protein